MSDELNKTGIATRDELLSYLDTAPTAEAPTWNLIGPGFNDLTEALNPIRKDSHYIHQKNGTSSVTGYAPESSFEAELDKADPVCMFIADIGRERKTGSESETDILIVYTWIQGSAVGKLLAYKQRVAILADNPGSGKGGESLALTGSFLYKGDPVKGDFDPKTKTFTEASAAA